MATRSERPPARPATAGDGHTLVEKPQGPLIPVAGDGRAAGAPRPIALAFQVLEAVALTHPIGVSALARHLGMAKSTVQRNLRALESLGYLFTSGEPPRWLPTLRAFQIGSHAAGLSIRGVAQPALRAIVDQTGETAYATLLEGRNVVVIEKVDAPRAVRAHIELGYMGPAHISSSGLAMLAASDESVVRAFLERPLERYTAASIVDPDDLLVELANTRERGYGISAGYRREEVATIGVAVRDARGAPVAGLSFSTPIHRFDEAKERELSAALLVAARVVSQHLGGNQR